jgi:DNA-binding transcriptional LysR family regulator
MDRLDLRLVEYFVTVGEELHFGRAAERLHIAQPSLSQQIRRLELQLGVMLLERTSRRVALTPAGETLLREGRRTLAQARRAMKATRAAGAQRLVVGFYGSAASALLPEVIRRTAAQQTTIVITVRELLLGSVDDILDGRVDVAFTRLIPGQADLEIEVIAREPRLVALTATHPLAGRDSIRFSELRDESFIVNPAVEADGAPARWLAEQRRHGLPGRVAANAASVQEILTLVAAGRGVCLVPASAARGQARADVVYVRVRDADPAVISLAWREEHRTEVLDRFIETAREVAELVGPPGSAVPGGAEHAPQNAMLDPGEIARFHDRCSDLMRELLDGLAAAPDRPRPFPEVEDAIGWPRRRIASVLGGVCRLRMTEFGGRRPYRFLDEKRSRSGRWEIWMDGAQAHAVRVARRMERA